MSAPAIPDTIKRTEYYTPTQGSPFKMDELTGLPVFLSPPGTKILTSEDVRKLLEDFP